jgi:hypothetical protein
MTTPEHTQELVDLIRRHGLTPEDLIRAHRLSQQKEQSGSRLELILRATTDQGRQHSSTRKVVFKWTPSEEFATRPKDPLEDKDPTEIMAKEVGKLLVDEAAAVLPDMLRAVLWSMERDHG